MIDRSTALTSLLPDRDFLKSALAQGVRQAAALGRTTLVSLVTPFHHATLSQLTTALDPIPNDAFFWTQPGGDMGLLGIETALSLEASGASRFDEIRQQWADLIRTAIVHDTEP